MVVHLLAFAMALAAYPTGLEQSPASSPEPLVVKSWYRCSSRITETILELDLESTEELLEMGKTPVELRIDSADGDKTFMLSVRVGGVYKGAIGAWIVTLQDPSLPSADRGNYLLQPNRGYRPDGTGEADIPAGCTQLRPAVSESMAQREGTGTHPHGVGRTLRPASGEGVSGRD